MTQVPESLSYEAPRPLMLGHKRLRVKERIIEGLLFLAGSSSVVITLGIVGVLLYEASTFFAHVSIVSFLTDTEWTPLFENPRYGIMPLLCGTLVTTMVALCVAIPVGTISAIWLSEYAPRRLREIIKPALELLGAVPTVVYGYFAFLFVTPFLQQFIPGLPGFNMLSAGLVMGLMIIPYISSLSEDAMHAVPMHIREGSYAMGATRMQTALKVIVPSSFSGITAAYILGVSRAVGETMVVAIAAGTQPQMTLNPTQPGATITAFIVQVSLGDLPHGSIGYQSIFAAGLMLMLLTLVFNIGGYVLRRRYREVYLSVDDLKRNVARRKRWDLAFAVVGAVLITGSLAVLGILIGDLVRDGSARLGAKTFVKEDGQAPGRRDVVGKLVRTRGADAAETWELHQLPIELDVPEDFKTDLGPLAGQRVVVSGSLPAPDEAMEVEKVVPLPGPGEKMPRIGRRDFVGVLTRDPKSADAPREGWRFQPDTLTLDISAGPVNAPALEGETVAVTGTKAQGDNRMAVDAVERMIPKGFFNSMPSRKADRAGILSAWVGTILVMVVTICTALPLGVAAGIYLEEYAPKNWLTAIIEINIANLAGVPSIIWGLMALGLFIYQFGTGRSVLTAGLTLGLLVLPIIIISTREAIRAIPTGIRDASVALGATKWETVRHHLLPYSMGGILTGTIVSLSRAIGETAPLITIGALTYVAFLPESPVQASPPFVNFEWLRSPFTVLPIQMFNWISRPDRAFHNNAAAAGVVLIVMTLGMNAIAIILRHRLRKRIKW